jgi:predicted nuclease with RNAse H fold
MKNVHGVVQLQYLGIDIAGAKKTWMCALTTSDGGLSIVGQPIRARLEQIIQYTENNPVVSIAIDAQLTWAVSDENGLRESDDELRDLLPKDCRNWVASQNFLAAVPVRGRQLAECLSPIVGTIIETHPRACLLFANKSLIESVKLYKDKKVNYQEHITRLWQSWTRQFGIKNTLKMSAITDDALDSLVCATIAYLFHHSPHQLTRLSHSATDKRGRGPFFVLLSTDET